MCHIEQCKIDGINAFLEDLQVDDIKFKGHMHTWSNNQSGIG